MVCADQTKCTAFEGPRQIASGTLAQVALKAKEVLDAGDHAPVLIFDDLTGEQLELDFRGTPEDVLRRLARDVDATARRPLLRPRSKPRPPRGPGRPKLGVVAREVTLLPRHWDWLGGQPGARPLRCASSWKRRGA